MTKQKPTKYLYRNDCDGCDSELVIYDAKTKKDILSLTFWETDTDWADRTKAKIELLIANPKLLLSLRGASEDQINDAIKRFAPPAAC